MEINSLEDFEDALVDGIDKIHAKHIYQAIRPHTLHYIEQQAWQLLEDIGRCLGGSVRDKVIVKVAAEDYGRVTVDFLDPREPLYEIRYDGTVNRDNIVGYRKFHHAIDMYYKLIGLT